MRSDNGPARQHSLRRGGGIRLATRGSLNSDQATVATDIWQQKYPGVRFGHDVTPLFEIVYPDNRIVTDYGDMRDLVLLAVIDMATGADLPHEALDWPGPRAARPQPAAGGDSAAPRPRRRRNAVRPRPGPGKQPPSRPARRILALVRRLRGRVPQRRYVPANEVVEMFAGGSPLNYEQFRADVDAILDQSVEPRF